MNADTATATTSVVLADDHTLVRQMLASFMNDQDDIDVIGECANANDAITLSIDLCPDVVVLDIDMPGILCFEAARTIKARRDETRILFLSAFFHDRYIEDALRCEASGYLTKGEPPQRIADAIRTVAKGGIAFSQQIRERIIIDGSGARLGGAPTTRGGTLTRRELETLRYIARGLSKKEIAEIAHISVKTVDNHCQSLMNKLDIHDRVGLTRYAIREGLAEA